MTLALIGQGAIGKWICEGLDSEPVIIRRGDALPKVDVVVEAAGHSALSQYGVAALPAGAIAGVDALSAARRGGLTSVRYLSRKPPAALGDNLPRDRETILFEGNARDTALRLPRNANVAATVVLAGIGFRANRRVPA